MRLVTLFLASLILPGAAFAQAKPFAWCRFDIGFASPGCRDQFVTEPRDQKYFAPKINAGIWNEAVERARATIDLKGAGVAAATDQQVFVAAVGDLSYKSASPCNTTWTMAPEDQAIRPYFAATLGQVGQDVYAARNQAYIAGFEQGLREGIAAKLGDEAPFSVSQLGVLQFKWGSSGDMVHSERLRAMLAVPGGKGPKVEPETIPKFNFTPDFTADPQQDFIANWPMLVDPGWMKLEIEDPGIITGNFPCATPEEPRWPQLSRDSLAGGEIIVAANFPKPKPGTISQQLADGTETACSRPEHVVLEPYDLIRRVPQENTVYLGALTASIGQNGPLLHIDNRNSATIPPMHCSGFLDPGTGKVITAYHCVKFIAGQSPVSEDAALIGLGLGETAACPTDTALRAVVSRALQSVSGDFAADYASGCTAVQRIGNDLALMTLTYDMRAKAAAMTADRPQDPPVPAAFGAGQVAVENGRRAIGMGFPRLNIWGESHGGRLVPLRNCLDALEYAKGLLGLDLETGKLTWSDLSAAGFACSTVDTLTAMSGGPVFLIGDNSDLLEYYAAISAQSSTPGVPEVDDIPGDSCGTPSRRFNLIALPDPSHLNLLQPE